MTDRAKPVAVHGNLRFKALAAGGLNTCGLTESGAAYCWGYNFFGQLGIGSTFGSTAGPEVCRNYDGGHDACSTTPVAVSTNASFSGISILDSPCGLTSAGTVFCWGRNDLGQLGDSTKIWRSTPVVVSGGLQFAMLATSSGSAGHACALTASGAAYCWGSNYYGEIGTGSITGPELCNPGSPSDVPCSTTPVAVSGGLNFSSLGVGGSHTCGLARGGTAYCWGSNGVGALGDGTTSSSATPVAVSSGLTFSTIALGVGHTCGLTSSGTAYCWGLNYWGQLGTGSAGGPAVCSGVACSLAPVAVSGGLSFNIVAAGGSHTCGLTSAGAAYCWGDNSFSQLGDGTTTQRLVPTAVASP
jgi:hypothetical protein